MRTRSPSLLIVTVLMLVGSTAAVLVGDLPSQARDDERAQTVQRLVGGLGFGPAVDLSCCPFGFDPRLGCTCQEDQGPIPGGGWFCPQHACSAFYYPPLDGTGKRGNAKLEKQGSDGVEIR